MQQAAQLFTTLTEAEKDRKLREQQQMAEQLYRKQQLQQDASQFEQQRKQREEFEGNTMAEQRANRTERSTERADALKETARAHHDTAIGREQAMAQRFNVYLPQDQADTGKMLQGTETPMQRASRIMAGHTHPGEQPFHQNQNYDFGHGAFYQPEPAHVSLSGRIGGFGNSDLTLDQILAQAQTDFEQERGKVLSIQNPNPMWQSPDERQMRAQIRAQYMGRFGGNPQLRQGFDRQWPSQLAATDQEYHPYTLPSGSITDRLQPGQQQSPFQVNPMQPQSPSQPTGSRHGRPQ